MKVPVQIILACGIVIVMAAGMVAALVGGLKWRQHLLNGHRQPVHQFLLEALPILSEWNLERLDTVCAPEKLAEVEGASETFLKVFSSLGQLESQGLPTLSDFSIGVPEGTLFLNAYVNATYSNGTGTFDLELVRTREGHYLIWDLAFSYHLFEDVEDPSAAERPAEDAR